MERNVSLEKVSDRKRCEDNDLVKAGCGDCEGCSACCQGMGDSILLDPYDIKRTEEGLCMDFNQLMTGHTELNVVDHVILPNLKMTRDGKRCSFLDGHDRYSIHPYHPGFCRLLPLGGVYEDCSFRYFLQVHECSRENRTKVKIRKWVDTPDFKSYERSVTDWHYFLKDLRERLEENGNQETIRAMNMHVLNQFYVTPYRIGEGFYPQFYRRLETAAATTAVQRLALERCSRGPHSVGAGMD